LEVASRLGTEVGQIDVGFTSVYDGIGVFACPFSRQTIRHRHLKNAQEKEDEEKEMRSVNGERN